MWDLIDSSYFLDSLLATNKRTKQENEMCSLKEENGEYYTLFQDLLDQLSKFGLVKWIWSVNWYKHYGFHLLRSLGVNMA